MQEAPTVASSRYKSGKLGTLLKYQHPLHSSTILVSQTVWPVPFTLDSWTLGAVLKAALCHSET